MADNEKTKIPIEVTKDYKILEKIGEGSFGNIYKVSKNNKTYALKIISLKDKSGKMKEYLKKLITLESYIMENTNSDNILKCYNKYIIDDVYYLIVVYCNNGTLRDLIEKKKKLSESEAIGIMSQLNNGFMELNMKGFMHRDIKLENIFINDDKYIIGDFGFSNNCNVTTTNLGTDYTKAPEIFLNIEYDNRVDVWAYGVVLFYLVTGDYPYLFFENIITEIRKFITNLNNEKLDPEYCKLSSNLKDLFKKIFVFDYKNRITWEELFQNKIFTNKSEIKQINNNKIDHNINSVLDKKESNIIKTNKIESSFDNNINILKSVVNNDKLLITDLIIVFDSFINKIDFNADIKNLEEINNLKIILLATINIINNLLSQETEVLDKSAKETVDKIKLKIKEIVNKDFLNKFSHQINIIISMKNNIIELRKYTITLIIKQNFYRNNLYNNILGDLYNILSIGLEDC